jgi:hypothetical protein
MYQVCEDKNAAEEKDGEKPAVVKMKIMGHRRSVWVISG